jgi:hypothetical protein
VAKSKPPQEEGVPRDFPEVTSDQYARSVGGSHQTEMLMQIQMTLGELKTTVQHLKEASDNQARKVEEHGKYLFAAGVVLAIGLAVGGFFLSGIKDLLMIYLENQNGGGQ